MPATKEQIRRLMELDKFFQNDQKWKAVDLLNKLAEEADIKISDRTLKEDLAYLNTESDGILVSKKIGREWLWFYTDSNYSHFRKSLLPAEFADLQKMITTFKEWGDLPFWQEIELMLGQFETRLSLNNRPNRKLIEFQKPISIGGSRWLKSLYDSIDQQTVIIVSFQSLRTSNVITIDLLPYLLKEHNNRWWLIAWSGKSMINIALETIDNIEASDNIIDTLPFFDSDNYFNDILGVTKNHDPVETIRLRVSSESANYLRTKPIHSSQQSANDDDTEITLRLIPNYELQQAILQFGPQVEVIEPESLRKTIGDKLKEAALFYKS